MGTLNRKPDVSRVGINYYRSLSLWSASIYFHAKPLVLETTYSETSICQPTRADIFLAPASWRLKQEQTKGWLSLSYLKHSLSGYLVNDANSLLVVLRPSLSSSQILAINIYTITRNYFWSILVWSESDLLVL